MDVYEVTRSELEQLAACRDGRPVHAARLWKYLYREGIADFEQMADLPPRLRESLAAALELRPLAIARKVEAADGLTRKLLLRLSDGQHVETVLMRQRGRVTACLSSQVGCPLGCVFCASGQMGFTRNLSTGEIVAQALHAVGTGEPLRNVVLMGMGEPLLNYDAVVRAMEILRDPAGLAIGAKQLTLSTVGVVPGIIRLADDGQPCSLAVSLHAATQDERLELVPAARRWPLDELIDACRYYAERVKRRILFEWTLIEGRNDSPEQAHALARLIRGIPAQVNLIPLNRTDGFPAQPGAREALDRFRAILQEHGVPVSIRRRRGIEIAAGCGQLAGSATA